MYRHDSLGLGGLFVVFVLLVLVLGAVAALVVWALTRTSSTSAQPTAPSGGAPQVSSARAILDERFARGEIDEEEYRRRRILLDGGPAT